MRGAPVALLALGTSFLMSTESIPINAPLYANLADQAIKLPGAAS